MLLNAGELCSSAPEEPYPSFRRACSSAGSTKQDLFSRLLQPQNWIATQVQTACVTVDNNPDQLSVLEGHLCTQVEETNAVHLNEAHLNASLWSKLVFFCDHRETQR